MTVRLRELAGMRRAVCSKTNESRKLRHWGEEDRAVVVP